MINSIETPTVRPGGLVTIAFLKSRLDEGNDHLGLFMPLILDVVTQLQTRSFTTEDIQKGLDIYHGIAMPQQVIVTLLKRAITKKYIYRESGRYIKDDIQNLPPLHVNSKKAEIEQGQDRLAMALCEHAKRRGIHTLLTDEALEMLFRFLEEEQIAMLLGTPTRLIEGADTSLRERTIIAEFIQDIVKNDAALLSVLRGMLEGLVLYHATFLPDLTIANRRFRNLKVIFDSNLVRQALGYEGNSMRALVRDTIDVLKASGVQCIVFDKTIHEIIRILSVYERCLGSSEGRSTLKPSPMARHFLIQRYSPSDVREMSALIDREIIAAGFELYEAPSRIALHTAGERLLANRLKDPSTKEEFQPRIIHDVDCVAAVLTFRKGHRSTNLDDIKAIFATISPLVIHNTSIWWQEDEHETGIPPVVHIRALTNLAWLKKPSFSRDLKIHDLVALCTATLRPTPASWGRFLNHLYTLQNSQRINSNEVTAILVSAMSDNLLKEAEVEAYDPTDIDAVTLDEVVERVKASYAAEAEAQRKSLAKEFEDKLTELESREHLARERADLSEHSASEQARRQILLIEGRARTWASGLSKVIYWGGTILVIIGGLALIITHSLHGGWLGILLGIAVVTFVFLELMGILKHLSDMRMAIETKLTRIFRKWLDGYLQTGTD